MEILSSSIHSKAMNFLINGLYEGGSLEVKVPWVLKALCLERSSTRLILVIQLEFVANDVSYLCDHALICYFMGIQVSPPFLELWTY